MRRIYFPQKRPKQKQEILRLNQQQVQKVQQEQLDLLDLLMLLLDLLDPSWTVNWRITQQ